MSDTAAPVVGKTAGENAQNHPESADEGAPAKVKKIRIEFSLKKLIGLKRDLSKIEKFFVALVLTFAVLGSVGTFYGLTLYRRLGKSEIAHTHHEESNSEHSEEENHGSGEDSNQGASVITQNAIPDSILERQDGKIEETQDLIEPEIINHRDISSVMKDDLKFEGLPKYVDLTEIIAGTRGSQEADAVMIGDIVLLVDNYDVQQEALGKVVELKAIVSSLVADITKDELRTFEGKTKLKTLVQREMNHLLKKGQVKDVLLSKFLLR